MNPIFTKMVDAVETANAAPDDYINSADGLKSVSYTHLDVYKRQSAISAASFLFFISMLESPPVLLA